MTINETDLTVNMISCGNDSERAKVVRIGKNCLKISSRIFILVLPHVLAASAVSANGDVGELASEVSRLNLVCIGDGAANRTSQSTVNTWNSSGDFGGANIVGRRVVPFDDQVHLWIEGESGQIRMPRAMLPPVRGGENGWFKIKSIKLSRNEITGSVAVNVINNPKLILDRITGSIQISGKAGTFGGRCAQYDPANAQRAF